MGAVPSKGQRLPSTGHGTLLWTAATSHGLQHPSQQVRYPQLGSGYLWHRQQQEGMAVTFWLRQDGSWNLHQFTKNRTAPTQD